MLLVSLYIIEKHVTRLTDSRVRVRDMQVVVRCSSRFYVIGTELRYSVGCASVERLLLPLLREQSTWRSCLLFDGK